MIGVIKSWDTAEVSNQDAKKRNLKFLASETYIYTVYAGMFYFVQYIYILQISE